MSLMWWDLLCVETSIGWSDMGMTIASRYNKWMISAWNVPGIDESSNYFIYYILSDVCK